MKAFAFLPALLLLAPPSLHAASKGKDTDKPKATVKVEAEVEFADIKEMGGVVKIGRGVTVPRDSIADGPIVVVAGDVEILGDVDDDVVVVGGKLKLDAKVQGDVFAIGPDAELGPNADITGDFVTIGTEIAGDPAAVVRGQMVNLHGFGMGVLASLAGLLGVLAGLVLWFKLFSAFGWVLLTVLAALFTPRSLKKTAEAFADKPGFSCLGGFLLVPGLLLLTLALTVSIIGLPIVPLLWVFTALALIWGAIAMALWLGGKLLKAYGRETDDVWPGAVAGMIVLQLSLFVPVLGKALFLIAAGIGAGATLVAILGGFKKRF